MVSPRRWIAARLRRRPRVFLWPTLNGAWWLGTLAVLFLIGWGYANNICLALAVLLLTTTVVLLLEAHFNLDGIRPQALDVADQFAGQPAAFRLRFLSRRQRTRRAWRVEWDGEGRPAAPSPLLNAAAGEEAVEGVLGFRVRGHHRARHLKLSSTYPLGLFRAWSYHALESEAWSWPTPSPGGAPALVGARDEEAGSPRPRDAGDEPAELRPYVEGDPTSRVAWKVLARGLPAHTRSFEEEAGTRLEFHWPWGAGGEAERARLAQEIHSAYLARATWKIRAEGRELPWGEDAFHHRACLRLLAVVP